MQTQRHTQFIIRKTEELCSQKYSAPDLQTPSYQSPARVNVYCLVTKSCPTLCNPMDCSKPGSSLSFTISQSLLRLMSIEWVMPSNHAILSLPSPPALSLSQHQGLFNHSVLHLRWPKYWSFNFSITPSGLGSFRIPQFSLPPKPQIHGCQACHKNLQMTLFLLKISLCLEGY